MKEIKEALAQRCIDKQKEPMYMAEMKSITNVLNKSIHLSDVKKGDVIYIDCTRIPMKDVSRWPGMKDGRVYDTSDIGTLKIKVQDIAQVAGHYLIEYDGGMLTTLDFENEWEVKHAQAKSEELTRITQNAMGDVGHWFKPNIEAFIKYHHIDVSKVDRFARREIYDAMMCAVAEKLQEKGIEPPYKGYDIHVIRDAANDAIRDYQHNGLKSIREDMARKIVEMGRPLIHIVSMHEMESNNPSVNVRWEKLPKNLPIYMRGRFEPMTVADGTTRGSNNKEVLRFDNITLEEVIKTKDGSVFYVTNVGIFTATDMAEEYRNALVETQQVSDLCLDEKNTVQRYVSLMQGGLLESFSNHSVLLPEYREDAESQNISKESIAAGAKDFAQNAIEGGKRIVHCSQSYWQGAIVGYEPHERDPNAVSPKYNELTSILPGESIGLRVNSAIDISTGEQVSVADIHIDEIQANDRDFIVISGDTVYTTYPEIIDAAREIIQEIEQTQNNDSQDIGNR